MDLIERTFNNNDQTLPTTQEIRKIILTYDDFHRMDYTNFHSQFSIRSKYIKNSFVILSHELILSIIKMVNKLHIKKITELHSGIGWLSYWLKKYKLLIQDSIDNKSFYEKAKYLEFVVEMDSAKYIKKNKEIELFVLSWPYMDNSAEKIWKTMKKGQFLLYFGEWKGGCTANDNFFRLVEDKQLLDLYELNNSYLRFFGVNDCPYLFKK